MRHNPVYGTLFALDKSDALSLFPISVNKFGRGREEKMKFLKNLIFVVVATVGLTLAVSAQKGDPKPPPKNPPPKIEPKPKDPPKGGDKPQKPGMSFYVEVPMIIKRETDA